MDYLEIIKSEKPQEGLESFAQGFCQDRIAELSQMEELMKKSDFGEVGKIIHKWKGFSAPYGFNFLGSMSIEIEKLIQSESVNETNAKLAQVREYLLLKKTNL